ncbi:MAG: protein tyrosine phosphatase family protein [Pseudomonadota bacterium]|uniref:protein tyrosine phosphatase family protein n=1 Tax=Methylophaga aminisulfidivorans TaxID=230105 RepID=UPI0024E1A521|nr:protein tyrosine phosphatase family protein [Methylophaga aminisulfidivorans]MEC9411966.1 protein tyrosine phosphatase family protein [Pseudomonadota bacterium]
MQTNIKNYLAVTTTIASSGQPAVNEFEQIAEQGYQVIINLAMPDSSSAIADEGHIVTGLGMSYVHIPIPFDEPKQTHLIQFFNVMAGLSDRKIWVHCALNYRASAFLYLYLLIVKRQSKQQASAALLPSWKPNTVWADFMQQSETGLCKNL